LAGIKLAVKLYFSEPGSQKQEKRIFDVRIQNERVLANFEIAQAAGGPHRQVVKTFRHINITDDLRIQLSPTLSSTLKPVLSGVELIREN